MTSESNSCSNAAGSVPGSPQRPVSPSSPADSTRSDVDIENAKSYANGLALTPPPSSLSSSPPLVPCKSPTSGDQSPKNSTECRVRSPLIDPGSASDEEYFDSSVKRVRLNTLPASRRTPNGLTIPQGIAAAKQAGSSFTSFLINDILNCNRSSSTSSSNKSNRSRRSSTTQCANNVINSDLSYETRKIVRPWDLDSNHHSNDQNNHDTNNNISRVKYYNPILNSRDLLSSKNIVTRRPLSADDDSRSERSESESPASPSSSSNKSTVVNGNMNSSPLDALFEMTSKTLEGLNNNDKLGDTSADNLSMFSNRQAPKKKRKSRTAFTNHQIFELEKRFLYQKYLSPADRDELAQSLSLTGAQVITWFQNRRAKLKRDMEELKKDMETAKMSHFQKGIFNSIQDLSLLKSQELHNLQQQLHHRKTP